MGMFVVAPYHHHHGHHHDSAINLPNSDPISSASHGMGVNLIPLLSAAPCLPPDDDADCYPNSGRGGKVSSGIQFWQNQQQYPNSSSNNNSMKKNNPSPSNLDHNNTNHPSSTVLLQTGGGGAVGGGGGMMMSSSSMATCQDCGNQAKKDCPHRRCRTCCKSRGFDCATHVKSTWVPAARRRERQQLSTGGGAVGSSTSTSGAKKPRLIAAPQTTTTSHTSTSNTTPSRSFDTTSSHQDAGGIRESLPGQVRAPAVFRCVRVTAVEDGEDEYAYQAVVKIGGHIYKGVLYDQGPESSSGRDGSFPNLSELHLGGSSSSPIIDPSSSDVYAASGGGSLRGGSTYGNPMN